MSSTEKLSAEAVLDGFISVLLEHGAEKVPQQYRKAVQDAVWKLLCDPMTGFWFFWLWFAVLQIKGRKRGPDDTNEYGWQRACPGGKPRTDPKTGRDWAYQVEVAKLIPKFAQFLILKARQIGFSFILANFIVWAAMFTAEDGGQGVNIAVVANKLQSSKRLMRRARSVYNRLPIWMQARVLLVNPAIMGFEFSNGSRVEPYSGDPDALRSDAPTWTIVDEIGEIEHLMDFYAAVESLADDGGSLVMFGTAKDNGLEQYVTPAAQDGVEVDCAVVPLPDGNVRRLPVMMDDNEIHFLFVPDHVHPSRDDVWYERALKRFKGNMRNFQREHPRDWREAFIAQGSGYFNAPRLKIVRDELFKGLDSERDRLGTILRNPKDPSDVKFVEDPYGYVTIHATEDEFAALMATRRPWVIGADCAGDRVGGKGDAHAASGLQIGNAPFSPDDDFPEVLIPHKQIVTIHGRFDSDEYAEQLVALGWLLGRATLAIETNGVGAAVIKTARRLRYPALYIRRSRDNQRGGVEVKREYGWWSDQATKNIAYGELERCLRNEYTEIRDYETVLEMANVLHLGGGRIGAKDPKHDDRPDGLSIAHALIPYAKVFSLGATPISTRPKEPPYGSLEWVQRQLDAKIRRMNPDAGILGNENAKILA